jgi:hypothetical protein
MRFLLYTLGDDTVPMSPPTPELMAEMGAFMADATAAGVLVATGGLEPSANSTKVIGKNGTITVTDGPFTEAKELTGGWALVDVADKAEAVSWAKRFRAIVGDGESTIRQTFGPE